MQIEKLLADLDAMEKDETFLPSLDSLMDIHKYVASGGNLLKLRADFFSKTSASTWNRFKKAVFQASTSGPEDVAVGLLTAQESIEQELVYELNRYKEMREEGKMVDKQILETLRQLSDLKMSMAKTLSSIGAIGQKSKAGIAIQIITNIPRPAVDGAVDNKPASKTSRKAQVKRQPIMVEVDHSHATAVLDLSTEDVGVEIE